MLYSLAPMEGITNYIFRQVYHRHYPSFDRYYTPFLAARKLAAKEKKEISPDNNKGMTVIPQILSNQPDVFLDIAKQLEKQGYREVNLNLGCPSGTVVPKGRGAGALSDLKLLGEFLDTIFEKCPLSISIKTRIGLSSTEEWADILNLYRKYPLKELIIHPRLREDYYGGSVREEALEEAIKANLPFPICYNGDITGRERLLHMEEAFPSIEHVMIGRGMIMDPALLCRLKGEPIPPLHDFLEDLCDTYLSIYGPGQERNVLFKLKDVWSFLGMSYPGKEKQLKELRKANSIQEYKNAALRVIG